jgi:dolichyl-phosphate-mannose-protein mannosyltransferase
MRLSVLYLCALVLIVAFCLRYYNISYPSFRWMDEARHVPAASNYWVNGQFETDNWEHPPLRHIILYGFIQVFGDNPHGWRLRNVLFGSLAAVLTLLFAMEVSGSRRTGLLAGLLMATDPLHIMLSRFTFEEVYGGAFLLASVVLYLIHDRKHTRIVLSALCMGCALAIKWYVVPCWIILWLLCLWENRTCRDVGGSVFVSVTWLLLPLTIFILAYYPWFGRGYTLTEFIEFIANAYYSLQSDKPEHYEHSFIFLSHISAKEWFLQPVMVGQGTMLEQGMGEFALFINNLPVWIGTFPSLVCLTVQSLRNKTLLLALPVMMFIATYMLYLLVSRPVFLYSAGTLLPFAFTAVAICVTWLADKFGGRIYYAIVVLVLGWNLYLYPLVTAKKVPVAWYLLVLKYSDILKN